MPTYKQPTRPFHTRQMPKDTRERYRFAVCRGCGQHYEDGLLLAVHVAHALVGKPRNHIQPRPRLAVTLQCRRCGTIGGTMADLPLDEALDLVHQLYTDSARYATVQIRGGEPWPTRASS